jgi:hypothetical protein
VNKRTENNKFSIDSEHHSPKNQRRPHGCCADFHSRYYTLRCYWDPTDGISLCLDVDAMDLVVRTRNGFVAAVAVVLAVDDDDEWLGIREGVENVPTVAL